MRRWVTVVLLIFLAGYGGGCSVSSDGGTAPEPDLDRTTPENLMNFFADAYERRDIDKYAESLHDEYQFTFLPADADSVGLPPDEPWWGKTEDVAGTAHMFDAQTVTKIEMHLEVAGGPWPTEDGLGYRLDPLIKVTEEKPNAEEPLTHIVEGSWLYVEIVVDPYDENLWVFKEIEEVKKEGMLTAGGE